MCACSAEGNETDRRYKYKTQVGDGMQDMEEDIMLLWGENGYEKRRVVS